MTESSIERRWWQFLFTCIAAIYASTMHACLLFNGSFRNYPRGRVSWALINWLPIVMVGSFLLLDLAFDRNPRLYARMLLSATVFCTLTFGAGHFFALMLGAGGWIG